MLPEAIRLVELRAPVPRYQREMLHVLARREGTSVDHVLTRQDVRRGAFGQQPPRFQHQDVRTQAADQIHVVLHQQHAALQNAAGVFDEAIDHLKSANANTRRDAAHK